MKPSMIKLI